MECSKPKKIIIAIDGFSSCGKSTFAKTISFLVQSHKHSFHHHHGPINNNTEVYGSHRKQIGGHSHHP